MRVKNLIKSYGNRRVLDKISLVIEEEKTTVILGESGCGKTTLLEILSGNVKDYHGELEFERDRELGISYIFQEESLIPWKTVYENIEYVLKGKIPQGSMREHIEKYLQMVNLLEYKNEYPQALSGGMKRRVGIARAFAFPSNYLFMDEPFEFLDIKTKREIREYFKILQREERKTVLFITHDIDSALDLGDRVIVFSQKPTHIKRVFEDISEREKIKEEIKNLFL